MEDLFKQIRREESKNYSRNLSYTFEILYIEGNYILIAAIRLWFARESRIRSFNVTKFKVLKGASKSGRVLKTRENSRKSSNQIPVG